MKVAWHVNVRGNEQVWTASSDLMLPLKSMISFMYHKSDHTGSIEVGKADSSLLSAPS